MCLIVRGTCYESVQILALCLVVHIYVYFFWTGVFHFASSDRPGFGVVIDVHVRFLFERVRGLPYVDVYFGKHQGDCFITWIEGAVYERAHHFCGTVTVKLEGSHARSHCVDVAESHASKAATPDESQRYGKYGSATGKATILTHCVSFENGEPSFVLAMSTSGLGNDISKLTLKIQCFPF